MQDRYKTLLEAIEQERQSEEKYYANIAAKRTIEERVASGILLTHLALDKSYYTVGEYIEIKFKRTKDVNASHKMKVGVGCLLLLEEEQTKSFRATVSHQRRDEIGVMITGDGISLADFPERALYKLELVYDERPYRVMKSTIEQVMKSTELPIIELREGIRLESPLHQQIADSPHKWSKPQHLNTGQQIAVKEILEAERMGIIHGPPGTGKTTTLVALIQTLIQREKKILVCGPSNNSVDLIARKLHQLGIKTIRLGNVTRIDDDVAELTLDEKARNHKDWGHIKKVKIEAADARRMAGQYKRKFGHHERQNRGLMYKEAKELRRWAKDLEERLIESIIDDCQVVCTTLIGSTNRYISDVKFQTVIIDEASQALEPECWTAMLKGNRVILAGDHKQLSPTIKSKEAEKLGLSTTLLDRMSPVLKYKYLLTTQYRMHEQILKFSNDRFYHGKLKSAPIVEQHSLAGEGAIVTFIDTSGCGFDEVLNLKSRSLKNEGEYFILREHILAELGRYEEASIGVISPYAEQVRYLNYEVSEDEQLKSLDITVNTIDGFQGQERDAIIISLVRSNESGIIGFLADERRLNVAMTRAKKRLVIIGDVATLGAHPLFIDLVDHIEKHSEYKSAWEYMG